MRYVSSRGDAPTLGFADVLLAGLATDGGLYVPETWPTLSPETIASFAGRPYADVALEILSPFVGDDIAPADLERMVRRVVSAVLFTGLLIGGILLQAEQAVFGTLLMIASLAPLSHAVLAGVVARRNGA